ncbi:MAG: thiamine phosphate synthase [Bacteroidales bacterium]
MNKIDYSLYLVTDSGLTRDRNLLEIVEDAVIGGVTIVQLREKDISTMQFYKLALQFKQMLSKYGVPLIINDRLDIALAVDADGIHVGQHDLPVEIIRKHMPKGKIIGLSVENVEQTEIANHLDVDYVAASPIFNTSTKTDTAPELRIEGLKEIADVSKHPIVAIGGMNMSNAGSIIKAGASGIAVVSAIVSADSPQLAAKQLLETVNLNKLT